MRGVQYGRREIFDLTIDEVVMGDDPPRSVPVIEMARAGCLIVKPPLED